MSTVGQAVLGVAGAVIGAGIGFVVAGPAGAWYGASLGFGLGLSSGGMLFPPSIAQPTYKPASLSIQTAQQGIAVPVIYGSRKVAGNLIWIDDFMAIEGHEKVGGKNSGQEVSTGFSYYVSMCWGICMSPPGLRRTIINIWAGKDLVPRWSYLIYDGSQTEPNPYVATFVDRPPVWKNLCYVLMPGYYLGKSNHIPQFTFETGLKTGFTRVDKNSAGYFEAENCNFCRGELWGTEVQYSKETDKIIIKALFTYVGDKELCGIYFCNPRTLAIEQVMTPETTPGYPYKLAHGHCWAKSYFSSGKYVLIGYGGSTATALWLYNSETEESFLYQVQDDVTYNDPANLYFSEMNYYPGSYPNGGVSIQKAWFDDTKLRIYMLVANGYVWTANYSVGYVEYGKYEWHSLLHSSGGTFEIGQWNKIQYFPEFDVILYNSVTFYGRGSAWVLYLNDDEVDHSDMINYDLNPRFPMNGISLPIYYKGHLYAGFSYNSAQPDFTGLFDMDLETREIVYRTPSFGNIGIEDIVATGTGYLLIGTPGQGIVSYHIESESWGVYNNANLPGLDPGWSLGDDFPTICYNPDDDIIYAGSYYVASQGWSGVVAIGAGVAGDMLPPDVTQDILTNDMYGIGLSGAYLDQTEFNITRSFCTDNDRLVSMIFSNQVPVLDALSQVLMHHDGFITYFNGKIAHRQFTWEEPTETISDVNNDFVQDKSFAVEVFKAGEKEYKNRISVEYSKRSMAYAIGIASADDIIDIDSHRLKEATVDLNGLCVYSRAETMAWILLKRSLLQLRSFRFPIGPKSSAVARPGKIVYLTDAQTELSNLPVRITAIQESAGRVITAEAIEENPYIYDSSYAPVKEPPTDPEMPEDPCDAAPSVQRSVGWLLDEYYTNGELIVAITYSKPLDDHAWAGASVYKSYFSGGPYSWVASNVGSGVIGTVTDTANDSGDRYIEVVLDTDYTLATISQEEFDGNAGGNLIYVKDKGYLKFLTAELISTRTWKLSGLVWAPNKEVPVDNSYGYTAKGDVAVFNAGTINFVPVMENDLGKYLYFKTPSFNFCAVEQSIAEARVVVVYIQGPFLALEMVDTITTTHQQGATFVILPPDAKPLGLETVTIKDVPAVFIETQTAPWLVQITDTITGKDGSGLAFVDPPEGSPLAIIQTERIKARDNRATINRQTQVPPVSNDHLVTEILGIPILMENGDFVTID